MTEEREGGKEVVREEVRGEAEVLAGERDRGTESWKEERREKGGLSETEDLERRRERIKRRQRGREGCSSLVVL